MTPADKPDLSKIPAWARAIMTTHEKRAMSDHIQRQIDAARAAEQRKTLAECAAMADRYGSQAAVQIRLRLMVLEGNEPTT